jgi:hypothetical protein
MSPFGLWLMAAKLLGQRPHPLSVARSRGVRPRNLQRCCTEAGCRGRRGHNRAPSAEGAARSPAARRSCSPLRPMWKPRFSAARPCFAAWAGAGQVEVGRLPQCDRSPRSSPTRAWNWRWNAPQIGETLDVAVPLRQRRLPAHPATAACASPQSTCQGERLQCGDHGPRRAAGAEAISKRIKEALSVVMSRGVELGNPMARRRSDGRTRALRRSGRRSSSTPAGTRGTSKFKSLGWAAAEFDVACSLGAANAGTSPRDELGRPPWASGARCASPTA